MKRWILGASIICATFLLCACPAPETFFRTHTMFAENRVDEPEKDISFSVAMNYPSYYAELDFQISKIELPDTDPDLPFYEFEVYTRTASGYFFQKLNVVIGDSTGVMLSHSLDGTQCIYRIRVPSHIPVSSLFSDGRLIFSEPIYVSDLIPQGVEDK